MFSRIFWVIQAVFKLKIIQEMVKNPLEKKKSQSLKFCCKFDDLELKASTFAELVEISN